ncbi:MAG: (Fe-S)-binding protein [Planctomycetota bacterium]|jgi:hypothetical protein
MMILAASMTEMIQNAWPAALLALGLGSLFALILLIASIKLKVVVDPKIEAVHAALPNIDCGACGFAGCGSYAKAVVADPQLLGKPRRLWPTRSFWASALPVEAIPLIPLQRF